MCAAWFAFVATLLISMNKTRHSLIPLQSNHIKRISKFFSHSPIFFFFFCISLLKFYYLIICSDLKWYFYYENTFTQTHDFFLNFFVDFFLHKEWEKNILMEIKFCCIFFSIGLAPGTRANWTIWIFRQWDVHGAAIYSHTHTTSEYMYNLKTFLKFFCSYTHTQTHAHSLHLLCFPHLCVCLLRQQMFH